MITVIASRSPIYLTTSSLPFSLLKIPYPPEDETCQPTNRAGNRGKQKRCPKLLNDINPYNATGPDAIPGRLLKSHSDEVADALTMLFQASLDQGQNTTRLEEGIYLTYIQEG